MVHADGTNMKFYVDGALAATVNHKTGAGYKDDSTITIGGADDATRFFTGNLDRIKFDDRALTPAQFDFPAVPPLGIRKNGNQLTLFWPSGLTGYALQASIALQSNSWVNVASQQQGNEFQATVSPTNSARFFRLRLQ